MAVLPVDGGMAESPSLLEILIRPMVFSVAEVTEGSFLGKVLTKLQILEGLRGNTSDVVLIIVTTKRETGYVLGAKASKEIIFIGLLVVMLRRKVTNGPSVSITTPVIIFLITGPVPVRGRQLPNAGLMGNATDGPPSDTYRVAVCLALDLPYHQRTSTKLINLNVPFGAGVEKKVS